MRKFKKSLVRKVVVPVIAISMAATAMTNPVSAFAGGGNLGALHGHAWAESHFERSTSVGYECPKGGDGWGNAGQGAGYSSTGLCIPHNATAAMAFAWSDGRVRYSARW